MKNPAQAPIDTPINRYIQDHFVDVPDFVVEFTQKARTNNVPPHHISPQLGKFLSILAKICGAQSILEIGTMWGYSTWWLAQAGIPVVTLEKDTKHFRLATEFFAAIKQEALKQNTIKHATIELRNVQALEELQSIEPGTFDFVFLDASKSEYPELLTALNRIMLPGSVLVADNILATAGWKGETVANENAEHPSVQSVQKFNTMIAEDPSWLAVPVTIDSGIMMAIKQ